MGRRRLLILVVIVLALATLVWALLPRSPHLGFVGEHAPVKTFARDGATRFTYSFRASYERVCSDAKSELEPRGFELSRIGKGRLYGAAGTKEGCALGYLQVLKDTRWRGPASDVARDGVAVQVLGAGQDPGWIRVDYIDYPPGLWDRIKAVFGF